ncbi:HmuY family protein [Tenacibaculum sp. AHE15PA]|uniref:HmuY family protein n=1 Tax=unclassified Tenacibaculum TaxID=2635139 RepID=UPI001C4F1F99|nr:MULTISPECIES: HmuY family protein [unclassified Tenacibaculum]QXP74737.1 HmuY family protein [Tenacibaculum sp. AHE14PA]QXP76248.1 HmuY family protein [Tenacibaculum sp. AHE15PA]
MRVLKSIFLIAIFALVGMSCSENEDPIVQSVEAKTVSNLYAPQQQSGHGQPISGGFTKFSFKEGKQVTGDNWDVAFRGLRVIVNGGSKYGLTDEPERTGNASLAVVKNVFKDAIEAPAADTFKQDASGVYAITADGGDDWYTYSSGIVKANAGTIIVVKTIEGNYAKMEIRSYYKGAPADKDITTSSEGRYYTFNYVYNPIVGDKSLK